MKKNFISKHIFLIIFVIPISLIGIFLLSPKTTIQAQTSDTTPPTTPTNLTATVISSSQINLSWTASTDNSGTVAGYNIYRCEGINCTPTTLITTSSTNSYSDTDLTQSTTYVYAVSAYDAASNTSSTSSTSATTTQTVSIGKPVLLSSQDFENDGWQSQFTGETVWGNLLARTTSNPISGSYSLRGNQQSGTIDGITGLVGKGNYLLDWRGDGNLVNETPDEMYFSYRFRHDDYNWNDSGDGKLFYFVDPQYSIRAMYYAQQLQEGRNTLRITYANGGYSDAWARLPENWGYSSLQLGNANVIGSMGKWRKFEYYINYSQHYFMQWVDGYLLTPTNGKYPDGKIPYDPNLDIHWEGIQFFYADSRDVGTATDGITGYAAGWQIDDLEFWNGLPSSTASFNLRADVDNNSQINTTDAMLTLRNSLGLDMSGTNWQSSSTTGDVNCDGNSNSTDAMLILRYSLGLSMEGTGWCI